MDFSSESVLWIAYFLVLLLILLEKLVKLILSKYFINWMDVWRNENWKCIFLKIRFSSFLNFKTLWNGEKSSQWLETGFEMFLPVGSEEMLLPIWTKWNYVSDNWFQSLKFWNTGLLLEIQNFLNFSLNRAKQKCFSNIINNMLSVNWFFYIASSLTHRWKMLGQLSRMIHISDNSFSSIILMKYSVPQDFIVLKSRSWRMSNW